MSVRNGGDYANLINSMLMFFGGNPLDEDVEIILTGIEILKALGATYDDFAVKINHRGIINFFKECDRNISR